jgi:hypothetical protein
MIVILQAYENNEDRRRAQGEIIEVEDNKYVDMVCFSSWSSERGTVVLFIQVDDT